MDTVTAEALRVVAHDYHVGAPDAGQGLHRRRRCYVAFQFDLLPVNPGQLLAVGDAVLDEACARLRTLAR